jgi:histidine kinase
MNSLLREAASNGLVVEVAPGRFKFAHDRIREAAYTLLPGENSHARRMLHLKIGRQLISWTDQSCELGISSAYTEESLLFHATKQLNLESSLIKDSWEKLDLAEQNFACAKLAARKTSFFPCG